MKREVEAKLKIESPVEIIGRLREAGAEKKCEVVQRDIYFSDADKKLIKTDRGLRLRCEESFDGKRYFLTYKGPKEKTRFKSRVEIEVEVMDYGQMLELLESLGFERRLCFEKRRQVWEVDECEVCIDELPYLGGFVEVEGSDEKSVEGVLEKLGLSGAGHIEKTYSKLMAEKMKEIGLDKQEAFFDEA